LFAVPRAATRRAEAAHNAKQACEVGRLRFHEVWCILRVEYRDGKVNLCAQCNF
jgi:hypothetical protein